jgi:hypothetical protein
MNKLSFLLSAIAFTACVQSQDGATVVSNEESEIHSNTCLPVARQGWLVESELLLVALEGVADSSGQLSGGELVAIDPYTGEILARYQTGPNPFGAVFAPDGLRAYVTDKQAGTLSELDLIYGDVLASVPVGVNPQQPVLAPDGKIYIALSGDQGIAVVDTSGGGLTVLPKIETGAGTKPHIVALSPDATTLWSTIQGVDPRVLAVELATGTQKNYRYDLVPRVIHASHDGAWFTGHHSTGLHFANLADGKSSTPYMDRFGESSEARKQIEGVDTDENGNLIALTHEGRRALVVLARANDGAIEKIRDISGLDAPPYWTSLDRSGQVVYVSIPAKRGDDGVVRGGVVQAWNLTRCSRWPMWTAYTGGAPKRMALSN